MTGISTLLLFGGLAPRLFVQAGNVVSADSAAADAAALDVAIADTLAQLRAGAIVTYSDAPDVDFATTLSRLDAAVAGLAGAAGRAVADLRLRQVADRLAAAATTRRQLLRDWRTREVSAPAWVVSGSSVPIRFVETRLRQALAQLPCGDAPSDFVRIAACVCHRVLDLARIELELGRDPQMKATAASLAGEAAATITDLDDWLMENGRTPVGFEAILFSSRAKRYGVDTSSGIDIRSSNGCHPERSAG